MTKDAESAAEATLPNEASTTLPAVDDDEEPWLWFPADGEPWLVPLGEDGEPLPWPTVADVEPEAER